MNERECYLFDLNGYLVVPGLISESEVADLRDEVAAAGVIDALDERPSLHAGFPVDYYDDASWAEADGPKYWFDSLMLDWGPAVRSLVADRRLHGYLVSLLGDSYRLDHAYGVFARGRTGSHPLHSGGTPFDPSQWYRFHDGRIHNAMVVVQVALTPARAGDGGFCCIPGSHKANLPLPHGLVDLDVAGAAPSPVVEVELDAGDVLIFSEAVTHGSRGWRGDHDRAALLYKYSQAGLQWERLSPFVSGDHPWEPRQARVLAPPYIGGRPPIEDE